MELSKVHLTSLLLILVALVSSCAKDDFYEDKTFAGGKRVSADHLNLGKRVYRDFCISCHGVNGDGKGVASKGLVPAPRNFKLGIFKFGLIPAGELPHDETLKNLIRHGLNGTAMLPWDLEGDSLDAVTQYIKTFAPQVWEAQGAQLGEQVTLIPDPFTAAKSSAIKRGKEIYHMAANCQACHRGYATLDEMNKYSINADNGPLNALEPDFYKLKLQEWEGPVKNLPPDFTWHDVRSASTVEELAHRIASGVGGGAMPSWKGVLEDDQIWAVAYYVRSLMDLRGKPERNILIDQLENSNKPSLSSTH